MRAVCAQRAVKRIKIFDSQNLLVSVQKDLVEPEEDPEREDAAGLLRTVLLLVPIHPFRLSLSFQ